MLHEVDLFQWRDAVLRSGDQERPHRVPLIGGRPPGEIDTLAAGGSECFCRYRLVANLPDCAVYDFVVELPHDDNVGPE
jgi:hypothetical protein